VTAEGDCLLLEVSAADFTDYVRSHPAVLEQLASAAGLRRRELDETRAVETGAPAGSRSLLLRMQRFFGIRA
jgi:hypothetical protein